MRRKILLFLFILLGALVASCHEDVTVEIPDYENKLAVFCILEPGAFPVLFLNRSKSYFEYTDTSREVTYITDALVIITDITNGESDTLMPAFGTVNRNYGGFSTLYAERHYYKGKTKSLANHHYRLDIWQNGKHLNAVTKVPNAIKIYRTTSQEYHETTFTRNDFILTAYFNDIAAEDNAYFGSVRSSTYTESEFTIDKVPDGQEITHDIFVDFQSPITKDSVVLDMYINTYTSETAHYLRSLRLQQQSVDDMFTEPVTVKHNINGGLGIFGAISYRAYYPVVIKRPE